VRGQLLGGTNRAEGGDNGALASGRDGGLRLPLIGEARQRTGDAFQGLALGFDNPAPRR
jgi:hypothetical protein